MEKLLELEQLSLHLPVSPMNKYQIRVAPPSDNMMIKLIIIPIASLKKGSQLRSRPPHSVDSQKTSIDNLSSP